MIVLRPEYKQVSSINHVRMSYEQIQQPWVDKIGHGVATANYKQASSTHSDGKWVQSAEEGANPKFLTSSSPTGYIQYQRKSLMYDAFVLNSAQVGGSVCVNFFVSICTVGADHLFRRHGTGFIIHVRHERAELDAAHQL
eukprot:scaffold22813_cov78-Cyclotella_meneghiniana.AAC.11